MSGIQVLAVNSTQTGNQPTPEQIATVKELRTFIRTKRLMDLKYDSSQMKNVTEIVVFQKRTEGTREVSGTISKEQDGKVYFTLLIEEKNDQIRQSFERRAKEVYAGLHLRGTRDIYSSRKIEGFASGWGAKIKLELVKDGTYEVDISASPHKNAVTNP